MKILLTALLTGGFCAVFAVGVDAILPEVMGYEVAMIAMISGFCGSIFAQLALRGRQ
jgi:energy-converting hydrogenase Eha subunit A